MLRISKESKTIENAYRIYVNGQVQGVGFRPLVYRIANNIGLKGTIFNSPEGAIIEVQGNSQKICNLLKSISKSVPPHAKIDSIIKEKIYHKTYTNFSIIESSAGSITSAEIPPDLSICDKCLNELNNKSDRRYNYPFINCTECGPRFSLIKKLPYDRPNTTMFKFIMCQECRKEYETPQNRRFHTQPNACPVCGPNIKLVRNDLKIISSKNESLLKTIELLKQGKIIAIKSIGGYHLVCDANNKDAIKELRKRKIRFDKPFAVMMPDIATIKKFCVVNEKEEQILSSEKKPIVLLRKKQITLDKHELIAPNNSYIGVMLPYTPLHYLIFSSENRNNFSCLVMTSGNMQDEPICYSEKDAYKSLMNIADFFLIHDRHINNRLDDSIVQILSDENNSSVLIRRSRGYVPESISLRLENKSDACILATGAQLKNTFCLMRNKNAYVSQYIGDLDNQKSIEFYETSVDKFKNYLSVQPGIIAYDMHPDYQSSIYAKRLYSKNNKLSLIPVQHHHAHIASVMAEKNLKVPLLGFAFDGLGYGLDGKIWGGECFFVKDLKFERLAHFEYFDLIGGDIAVKEIWRLAISLLKLAQIHEIPEHIKQKYPYEQILGMYENKINCHQCSSVGRIFDAVASIIDVRNEVTYEAQAAIELESVALNSINQGYDFRIEGDNPKIIIIKDIIKQIWNDKKNSVAPKLISAKFHYTLAEIITELSLTLKSTYETKDIVLSGGVFQNRVLLSLVINKLKSKGFEVHFNTIVPANDGGISLGQAWIASKKKYIVFFGENSKDCFMNRLQKTFNIYCDESRVENRDSTKMVIGALCIPRKEKPYLDEQLKQLFQKYHFNYELKWTKISKYFELFYKDIIDFFLSSKILSFRCIIVDKNKVDYKHYHNNDKELAFFKFYYLLLKNKLLSGNKYYIFVDKKPTRDKNRAHSLRAFLDSHLLLNKEHCSIAHLQAYDSSQNLFLQVTDLLTGIVGYDINEKNRKNKKNEIVLYLKKKIKKTGFSKSTFPWEEKFNVFVWEGNK